MKGPVVTPPSPQKRMSRTFALAVACVTILGTGAVLLLWPIETPRTAQPPAYSNPLYDPR